MKKTKTKLAVLVAASSITAVASAQMVIEEVVVTAQKREQNLQDVPLSVAVVSAEALNRRHIVDTRALVQVAPSVNFQDGFAPASTSFNIRGVGSFTSEGGVQPSVSMVVDDVPLGRAGEFVADMVQVERVEVLRGPQGTLFGRNSTGGVINITTKRPGDVFEGNIDTSFTTDDEQLYRFYVSGPFSDQVGMSLSGFYKDRTGHIENLYPGRPDAGGEETWGISTKLDIDASENLNVLLSADLRESNIEGFGVDVATVAEPSLDGLAPDGGNLRAYLQGFDPQTGLGNSARGQEILNDPFKVNIDGKDQFDEYLRNHLLSANVTWDLSPGMRLKWISAYSGWENEIESDTDGPGNVSNMGFGLPFALGGGSNLSIAPTDRQRHVLFDWFSQEIRLEGSNDRLDWIIGGYYQDLEETVIGNFEVIIPAINLYSGSPSRNKATTESMAAFADVTFRLTPDVDIFGGFRWTEEELEADFFTRFITMPTDSSDFTLVAADNSALIDPASPDLSISPVIGSASEDSGEWSGRLGIAWRATENVNLYTSISRSFVGAGVDLGRFGAPGLFVDPTIAEAFEIGIKSRWMDNRLQLNAALFRQDVSDLQTSALFADELTVGTRTQNSGDIEITGFEADVIFQATDLVRLSGGLAYIDAEMQDLLQPCWATGQTFAQGCNLDAFGNPVSGPGPGAQTDVAGTQAPNTPEWKYNISVDVDVPLSDLPFDGYVNLSYVWQDDVHFSLDNNPLLTQEDYGLLDIALGIVDKAGRYEVSVFGKNVTDEFFTGAADSAPSFIAHRFDFVPRGAQAYYGAKVKYNF